MKSKRRLERRGVRGALARRRELDRELGSLSLRLWRLVEPFITRESSRFDVHALFAFAVSAWNLPFLPAGLRRRTIEHAPLDEALVLFDLYVARLRDHRDDPRVVLEHDLVELPDGRYSPLVTWVEAEFELSDQGVARRGSDRPRGRKNAAERDQSDSD